MRRLGTVVLLAAVLAGCGVYSVRRTPSLPPVPARAEAPLDLAVALGDVRSTANGRPEPVDPATLAAIDADFVRAATASGLFREVRPHGSAADVHVDTVRELHALPLTPGRAAYLTLAGPLVFLAPGFPHPWDYRITRTVRLRGDVGGASIPLPEREVAYDERVWGANYWGGLAADPRRHAEGEEIVHALHELVDDSGPLLRRFEAAAREGDVEDAWLVGVQAGQRTE